MVGDCSERGDRLLALREWDIRRGLRSLDIIDEFRQIAESRKNKGGWGFQAKPTKFTKNARHRLLEAGAVIDNEFGLKCYEVTLTLPGSTTESMQLIADWSGWLCDRLLRDVRRNAVTSHWFYVWERQKRGALHLHFAIAGSDISEVKRVAEGLEYQWFELLLELKEKTGVDAFKRRSGGSWRDRPQVWQSHLASIRKSVAAYFSKYVGKSANPQCRHNKAYYPSRWWGSSRAVKQGIELRRHRWEIEGSNADMAHVCADIASWLEEQPGLLKTYSYDFDLGKSKHGASLGGGKVNIYYYDDEAFVRMQNWEPYVIEHAFNLGKFDADIDLLHADIPFMLRRHYKDITDRGQLPKSYVHADIAPPSPLSQPSSSKGKLSNARGTQAKPTLALRARLLGFLGGGDGEETGVAPQVDVRYDQLCVFDIDALL